MDFIGQNAKVLTIIYHSTHKRRERADKNTTGRYFFPFVGHFSVRESSERKATCGFEFKKLTFIHFEPELSDLESQLETTVLALASESKH